MRVLVLVVAILGLAKNAKSTNEDENFMDHLKVWLENAFDVSDHPEMGQVALQEAKHCGNEIRSPELLAKFKETIKSGQASAKAYFIEFLEGCIVKKIFIDRLKEEGPKAKTPDGKKRYQFFYKCVLKQNELAKGKYNELAKAVVEARVCGTYKS